MILLDGKQASASLKEIIKQKVATLLMEEKRPPHLVVIIVGHNSASEVYVANKIKSCAEVGYKSTLIRFDDTISEETLVEKIETLNHDNLVDGILVQLPLPSQIKEPKIIQCISPDKDVDGFHPLNAGKLMQGLPTFVSATPLGIMLLLKHYNIETKGKHAVVIGRSNIVGRPMSILLSSNQIFGNCTVTLCHSGTKNLQQITLNADIIVAALGIPKFVKANMVKPDAIVIDVGINKMDDPSTKNGFRLIGDVDFEEVSKIAGYISPVPGGVGLMTIAALLQNTWQAYENNEQ